MATIKVGREKKRKQKNLWQWWYKKYSLKKITEKGSKGLQRTSLLRVVKSWQLDISNTLGSLGTGDKCLPDIYGPIVPTVSKLFLYCYFSFSNWTAAMHAMACKLLHLHINYMQHTWNGVQSTMKCPSRSIQIFWQDLLLTRASLFLPCFILQQLQKVPLLLRRETQTFK